MRTKNLLFLVAGLILSLNITAQDDYLRVTELSQIQDGSSIIIAARHDSLSTTNYYAMTNDAAGKPKGISFAAVTSDAAVSLPTEITDEESKFCWTVGFSDGGYMFINPKGELLGYGASGTDFVKNGANSTWSITAAVSGGGTSVPNHNAFVITNVGVTNRSIAFRKYSNDEVYEMFAPYSNSKSNMEGDTYFFYIDIFVKSSEAKPVVSLPTFNPKEGDYTSTQNVTISCDTEDATIYYTLDGNIPSDTCAVYSKPIEVAKTTTVKAIAMKEGMTNSAVATAKYNIFEPVTVLFYCNGVAIDTITLAKGKNIEEMPKATTPEGFSFLGWSESEIETFSNTTPNIILPTTDIDEDMSLYAVYSVGNNSSVETEITSISKSDAVVIAISKDGKYYAMSSVKGSSGQPLSKEITVLNGKIVSSVSDDMKWNISYDKGDMMIYPDGDKENWLYCTSGTSNNSVRIGNDKDNNIFELKTIEIEDETYPDYLYNKSTERFVGAYYDKDVAIDWRAYKLTNSGGFPTNIKNQTYHFFKTEGMNYYCTNVVVPEAQTITANTTWNNVCVLNKITIENGATLTINGAMSCTNADNLIIKDGGQLIHNNSGVKATIEKEIKGYGSTNGAWYTISSPLVGNVKLSDVEELMSNNYDLYRYDEPTSVWQNVKDGNNGFTSLEAGEGYLYANENDVTISFVGEMSSMSEKYFLSRTEDVELSGFHLIGNPYAHNIYKGEGAAIDDQNLVTGYYTLSNSGAWEVKISDDKPIKPCQGILVKTIEEGNVVINKTNKMPSQRNDKKVLSVKVSNKDYEDNAYISFDDEYGLEKIKHQNEDIPMLYFSVDDVNYAIVTLSTVSNEMPLSFEAKTMGEYTISLDAEKGNFSDIYLMDKMTGNTINILTDDYTFVAAVDDNPDRFVLKLNDINSIDEMEDCESFVYVNNGSLIISDIKGEAVIEVYDVAGRVVINQESKHEISHVISTNALKTGIYVVRVADSRGVKTQKVFVE